MTQDVNMQEASQMLRSRLGSRWEGQRENGIDEMVRALEDGLKLSKSQARDAVDALITSGDVTYNQAPSNARDGRADDNTTRPNGGMVALPGTGSSPIQAVGLNEQEVNGYWRFGRDSTDADSVSIVGRAGQIDPTS